MQTFDSKAQWPGWQTVRLIGRGSYGAVYEIQRNVYGTLERAALKYISIPRDDGDINDLLSDGYDSASITQRYETYLKSIVDEYAHMAEMKGHPNIVYCDDVRCSRHTDGIGWDVLIKMELLTPLKDVLVNGITEDQVRKIGIDISNALVYCESKKLMHRDIKPQNIFMSNDGTFKLGDFGVAKTAERTVSGTKAGTYKYMAPEIYHNQPYGFKADVYSFGLTLYYLLNERRLPFLPLPPATPTSQQEDNAQLRRMSGEPLPPPQNGSADLKYTVLRACEYNPDRRCSAAELLNMLQTRNVWDDSGDKTIGIFHAPPPPRRPDPILPPNPELTQTVTQPAAQETKRKKRWIPFVAAGAALLLVAAGLVYYFLLRPETLLPPDPTLTPTSAPATPPTSAPTIPPTIPPTPPVGLDWSDWADTLPGSVTGDEYAIECRQVYRSTDCLSVSGTDTDTAMDAGYVFFEREYGEWGEYSPWQHEPVADSETVHVETKTEPIYNYNSGSTTDFSKIPAGATWTQVLVGVNHIGSNIYRYDWTQAVKVGETTYYHYQTRQITELYINEAGWSPYTDSFIPQEDGKIVNMKMQYRYKKLDGDSLPDASEGGFAVSGKDYSRHYYDVEDEAWYSPRNSDMLKTVDELGILLPDSYMRFHPDDQITIGQLIRAAVILHRLNDGESGLLCQNDGNYLPYVKYAEDAGMIVQNEFTDLSRPATRQEMAYLFSKALPADFFQQINQIDTISDMESSSYLAYALTMARAGIISVSENNTFRPEDGATRAEAAAMIQKLIDPNSRTRT